MAKPANLSRDERVHTLLQRSPIVPVVTVTDLQHAAPITEALLKANITIVEITLRTEIALEAIQHIASHYPEISVAAGTVLDATQMNQARDAGASLIVSPGYSNGLL